MKMRESLEMLRKSFARSLRAAHKSDKTITAYTAAVDKFIDFLEDPPTTRHAPDEESPAELLARLPVRNEDDICRAHVEAFVADQLARWKPLTAVNRFSGLQQWFRWMVRQPDIDVQVSPMAGMDRPEVPEELPPIVAVQHIQGILKTCDLKMFIGVRDAAIITLFCDTGIRLSECAGLMNAEVIDDQRVPSVDLDTNDVYVIGKGRRPRTISFGANAALALDRYMRARRKHPLKDRPELWLSGQARYRNPLTASGIRQMIDRRADLAGVPHIHPHLFRHTWADAQKRAGLSKEDMKRQGGWKSDAMVERYGAALGEERAREAHRRRSFMDGI